MGIAVAGGAVSFNEFAGEGGLASPNISAGRESREATREGIIAWTSIDALLLECAPNPPALPGVYPGVSYLYVDRVDIKPWPDVPPQGDISCPSGINVYTFARATIHYSTLKYDPSDLISRKTTYSVEAVPLPKTALKWVDSGLELYLSETHAYKYVPIIEHQITLHRASTQVSAAIRNEVGKVNENEFEGAAPETLLFMGASEDFVIGTAGVKTYTRTYSFKERRVQLEDISGTSADDEFAGWNHVLRGKEQSGGPFGVGFQRVVINDGTDNPPFPLSNSFSSLF